MTSLVTQVASAAARYAALSFATPASVNAPVTVSRHACSSTGRASDPTMRTDRWVSRASSEPSPGSSSRLVRSPEAPRMQSVVVMARRYRAGLRAA